MNVSEAIRSKRAVRQFADQPLPEETVQAILNAGRRAQSAKNIQPWHFIAIRQRSTLQALSQMGEWAGHLAGAALGVAIITPDPASRFSVMLDAGQAAAYMQLAAVGDGRGLLPGDHLRAGASAPVARLPPRHAPAHRPFFRLPPGCGAALQSAEERRAQGLGRGDPLGPMVNRL